MPPHSITAAQMPIKCRKRLGPPTRMVLPLHHHTLEQLSRKIITMQKGGGLLEYVDCPITLDYGIFELIPILSTYRRAICAGRRR